MAYPGMLIGGHSLVHETLVRGSRGEGFSFPDKGVRGVTPEIFLTPDMLCTSFGTDFVVKFISLVVAFKVFF